MLIYRGTILTEAKQPEAARAAIEQGRAIYEGLFKAGNMSHVNAAAAGVKLGEALTAGGKDREAEEEFRQALAIVEPMISGGDAELDALYAAADAYSGLGDLGARAARQRGISAEERRRRWSEARGWYAKSQDTWRRVEHPNHSAPNSFQAGDPVMVAREEKVAESALAAIH
jgi:tetratricopeptide (TPR) repeat protein